MTSPACASTNPSDRARKWILASTEFLWDVGDLTVDVVSKVWAEFEATHQSAGTDTQAAFGDWLGRSPIERYTKPEQQARAAAALHALYEQAVSTVPAVQRPPLDWFWCSYVATSRRARTLEAENKRLRELAAADQEGRLPAARHLLAIQVWSWQDVPTRLQQRAPAGVEPTWALLYRPEIDSKNLSAVRVGLQTIPHEPCVRVVGRQRAEFLW